jgi:hypothetical protein
MTLPNLGNNPRYLEELRIGGGYDASPNGGIDMDNAGNLAANGDLTLDGSLDLGVDLMLGGDLHTDGDADINGDCTVGGDLQVDGTNTTWSTYLSAKDGWPAVSSGAAGPTPLHFGVNTDQSVYTLDFDKDVDKYAKFNIILPPDYDGRPLSIKLLWTATSGTTGDVLWRVYARCNGDGDDLSSSVKTDAAGIDSFSTINALHSVNYNLAPSNASSGKLTVITVRRQGSHSQDTLDASARLLAIVVSYTN